MTVYKCVSTCFPIHIHNERHNRDSSFLSSGFCRCGGSCRYINWMLILG